MVELRIDGEIEPVLAEYIVRGINEANADRASLILITMNTPGGLDTSMREIIQAILASKVPVCTYVAPTGSRAASAGFFILLSADIAAMSPGTDTGAASPILAFGGQPVQIDETLHKKIVNEATAYLRSYVTAARAQRGACGHCRHRRQSLQRKRSPRRQAHRPDRCQSGRPARKTQRPHRSPASTARRFNWLSRIRSSSQHEMTAREKFLTRIVQPDVFFILLIVGVLGLYVEFTHPGMFAPGVIGGIALVLALFAMHMLPVNFTGLLLIIVAFMFFVLEAKFPDARCARSGWSDRHGARCADADSLAVHWNGREPQHGSGCRAAVRGDRRYPDAACASFAALETDHW